MLKNVFMQYKNGEEMVKSFLLEDLISVKKGDTSTIETEVKLVRRNYSSTSGIHSYEALCHVSQILCFTVTVSSDSCISTALQEKQEIGCAQVSKLSGKASTLPMF